MSRVDVSKRRISWDRAVALLEAGKVRALVALHDNIVLLATDESDFETVEPEFGALGPVLDSVSNRAEIKIAQE